MKKTLLIVYLVIGCVVCGWYTVAVANKWKMPSSGTSSSSGRSGSGGFFGGGRSFGGSWGGGK